MKPIVLTLLSCTLAAQAPSPEDELLALLNTPLTVASRKAMPTRESPGVVSLLTREDILASGARDLMDLLSLVPGFTFGMDTSGVVGPGFRGIWGYEGKILLLWDGVEMNETLYGTLPLGNHYPVDQIKRIEIIRGPGSAMYGGSAEVAVIQVTTLQAEDLQGVAAGATYGRGPGGASRTQFNALAGLAGDGASFSVEAYGGRGDLGSGTYTDAFGTSYAVPGRNTQDPLFLNVAFSAGGLQARVILDHAQGNIQDAMGASLPAALTQRFTDHAFDVRYAWKVSQALTLTPYVTYRDQKPWWIDGTSLDALTKVWVERQRGGLNADYAAGAWSVQGGLEFTRDQGTLAPGGEIATTAFLDGRHSVAYEDQAVFAQVQYQGPVNLTLGGRYEHHSAAGSAFVPRFAVTKTLGRWHFKVLAARSFRTPNLENLNQPLVPGSTIAPERTTSYEVEAGCQVGTGVVTLNAFSMKIQDPLVYDTPGGAIQGYANIGSVATKGFDLQYTVRRTWGYLNASLDTNTLDNQVPTWAVPGSTSRALAMPSTSGSILLSLKLGGGWTFNPTLRYLGSRTAWFPGPAGSGLVLRERAADLVAGANLAFTSGQASASLGVFDLSNRGVPYLQPYAGGHAPLPGMGREFVAKVRYGF